MIISKFFIIPEWYNKKWVIERIKKLANIFQLDLERRMSCFAIETELLKATQRILTDMSKNPGFELLFIPNTNITLLTHLVNLYEIKNYFDFFAVLMKQRVCSKDSKTLSESLSIPSFCTMGWITPKEDKVSEFSCLLLSFLKCSLKCCSSANVPLQVAYEMEGTTAKIFSDCLEYWRFDQKLMVKTLTGEYQEAGNLLKQRNYSSQTFFIPKDLLTSRRMFNSYHKI